MVRAALLTDAKVLFIDPANNAADEINDEDDADESADADSDTETDVGAGTETAELPDGVAAAALLRWRTGPPVPGAEPV
jgi:hypothetical protein